MKAVQVELTLPETQQSAPEPPPPAAPERDWGSADTPPKANLADAPDARLADEVDDLFDHGFTTHRPPESTDVGS